MEEIAGEIKWRDFLIPTIPELGFFSPQGIKDQVEKTLPEYENIEDLPVTLALLATNLDDGEEVVLDSGSLPRAVAASAAIPLVFNPVEYKDKILVDGGLINSLPDYLARDWGRIW